MQTPIYAYLSHQLLDSIELRSCHHLYTESEPHAIALRLLTSITNSPLSDFTVQTLLISPNMFFFNLATQVCTKVH